MHFSPSEDGVSFVYTHTHTHRHKRTHTHRTFSQNPAKFFPFSVEKNQLCLVVAFQKTTFDGVILFQSRALQSAPWKQQGGKKPLSPNIWASARILSN